MRRHRIAGRIAARVYEVLIRGRRLAAREPDPGGYLLGAALLNAFRADDRGWQDRVLEAGDPVSLLRSLDPAAQWFSTVLLHGWPVYPVRVSGAAAWLIVSRDISAGYPIRAVFFPGSREVVRRDDRESRLVRSAVDALLERPFPESAKGVGALVVGNVNFAHVFLGTWNALQRSRSIHKFRATDRLHDHGPATMGSFTEPELFPELADKIVPIDQFVAPDGSYAGTLVPIGIGRETVLDWRLDSHLRTAVRAVAERVRSPASDAFARRMMAAPFVLWISVRAAGERNVLNMREWIVATLGALHDRHLEPFVAFDGISIQPGFALESVVRGADTADQIRRERHLVEEIMAGSRLEYAYLGGLPLYDAFYLSRFASFYVCHQGSLDHKIKWLNPNLPGLVHSNLQRTHTHAWEPTLDRKRALYIPARFIRDEKPSRFVDRPLLAAYYPYRIEPVDEAAEWTARRIGASVASARVLGRSAGR